MLVITDHFSKLRRSIPAKRTKAAQIAEMFLDSLVMPHRILEYLLAKNETKSAEKVFIAVCVALGMQLMTTTSYPQQIKGQTEHFKHMTMYRLR